MLGFISFVAFESRISGKIYCMAMHTCYRLVQHALRGRESMWTCHIAGIDFNKVGFCKICFSKKKRRDIVEFIILRYYEFSSHTIVSFSLSLQTASGWNVSDQTEESNQKKHTSNQQYSYFSESLFFSMKFSMSFGSSGLVDHNKWCSISGCKRYGKSCRQRNKGLKWFIQESLSRRALLDIIRK